MSAHMCRVFDPACYRCDLTRDEMIVPEHDCDTGFFDRVLCPPPCSMMHSYCTVCHDLQDTCTLED